MELYLLAELKTISLKVTTVDMQKPPPDFRTNFEATPPPILIDRGMAILENEKIERHIMKSVPGGHNLFVQVGIVCFWLAMKQYTFSVLPAELVGAILIWLRSDDIISKFVILVFRVKHCEENGVLWCKMVIGIDILCCNESDFFFDYHGLTPTPWYILYKNISIDF